MEPGGGVMFAHWTVTAADPPMPGALHHWVLTPTLRVVDILDLPAAAHADMFAVITQLVGLNPGWCMASRAGDPYAAGGPVGVVDVVVGDPGAGETARFVMSGRMTP